mmetsp:Transcript_124984/g.233786  ORF Transcript_124984/g.233786 Transcript_124984/m.233786 type:complete len:268 (+) Transcript_124984:38-841(+)
MPKRAISPSSSTSAAKKRSIANGVALDAKKFRERLQSQGKYRDRKPGSSSLDGCLKDPPVLPPVVTVLGTKQAVPRRGADGCFIFTDHPAFKPNLSPKEVLQLGSFGGTYYRDIVSAVTGEKYIGSKVIKEFPKDWFKGLVIEDAVCSPTYSKLANKYHSSCGASLGQWESCGWISPLDPYGWFQWYCRFFMGRRTTDDERQIDRWMKGQGPTGRWRVRLCNDILKKKAKLDDMTTSPVLRQVLQHWAYRLTEADLERERVRQKNKK